jgi:beta-alanine--pyruvate transaminase
MAFSNEGSDSRLYKDSDINELGDNFWIPFTPNKAFANHPRLVAGARGVYYFTPQGRPVLDGVSGLFASAAGHAREEIAQAVANQLRQLDFTSSFYRSHPLAFLAAKKLAAMLPPGIDKIFFVNSGSEAVDTALKIALAYHRANGEGQRTLFVSRERAYHGVNFGGVALSGLANNRRQFAGSWPQVVHMRHTWLAENRYQTGQAEHGAHLADDLLNIIKMHGAENVAACVIEPIAGSTGVLVPPKGYLERIRKICDEFGVLLIMDEVICGFGRTGKAFAAQTFAIRPDIITLAKALTNGAQPMGAVAVDRKIYQKIINHADSESIEFFHGYTWSAHPAACAAAIASLQLYEDEQIFSKGEALSADFLAHIEAFKELPLVSDVRGFGLLGAIELTPGKKPGLRGYRLQNHLFDKGLHIKATGDAIILAPALVMTSDELQQLFSILYRQLSQWRDE